MFSLLGRTFRDPSLPAVVLSIFATNKENASRLFVGPCVLHVHTIPMPTSSLFSMPWDILSDHCASVAAKSKKQEKEEDTYILDFINFSRVFSTCISHHARTCDLVKPPISRVITPMFGRKIPKSSREGGKNRHKPTFSFRTSRPTRPFVSAHSVQASSCPSREVCMMRAWSAGRHCPPATWWEVIRFCSILYSNFRERSPREERAC